MAWRSEEFGSSHEGSVGVLLADGGEPGPVWLDSGSGSGGFMLSEWWVYDGRLGAQRAACLRGACSCGWRGARSYPVDWVRKVGWPQDIDISGPHDDWRQHVGDRAPSGGAVPDGLTRASTRPS
jgi:hypothetical protein